MKIYGRTQIVTQFVQQRMEVIVKDDVRSSTAHVIVTVTEEMTARLDGREIHPVYSTFWLAYHAEVAARRAIEPYFDEGENAVGGALSLEHRAMAPVGAVVDVEARVVNVEGNRIVCAITAINENTLLAEGTQVQIVMRSETLRKKVDEAYRRLTSS